VDKFNETLIACKLHTFLICKLYQKSTGQIGPLTIKIKPVLKVETQKLQVIAARKIVSLKFYHPLLFSIITEIPDATKYFAIFINTKIRLSKNNLAFT